MKKTMREFKTLKEAREFKRDCGFTKNSEVWIERVDTETGEIKEY